MSFCQYLNQSQKHSIILLFIGIFAFVESSTTDPSRIWGDNNDNSPQATNITGGEGASSCFHTIAIDSSSVLLFQLSWEFNSKSV
jgi:hypothetical protein